MNIDFYYCNIYNITMTVLYPDLDYYKWRRGIDMGKVFNHLTMDSRIRIELLVKLGYSVIEISKLIGVHRSTIYRELKRGTFTALNTDLTTEERYSPDIAHEKYLENLAAKGPNLKIGKDLRYANYLESKILEENYSPAAALGQLKAQGREKDFTITICEKTLYSYIDKGIFLKLTNKDLPVKKDKKRTYNKVRRIRSRASAGTSIEQRPSYIDTREEFGHWEMDTVVGKRGKSKHSLLVLTERKTRKEIIHLLNEHTARAVVEKLDIMEKRMGAMFKSVFKTITVDNGTEFSYCEEMERSIHGGQRTKVYYCHPYSSYERGTNEVTNKMIRRHIPKGVNFDDKTEEDIYNIEVWMNNYPREIHNYKSAEELYNIEVNAINNKLVG